MVSLWLLLSVLLSSDGGVDGGVDAGTLSPRDDRWKWTHADGGALFADGVTDVLTMRVGETARVMLPRPIVLMKCDQELLKLDATVDTLLLTAFKDGKTRCGFWYEKSAWPHRTMELEVKP